MPTPTDTTYSYLSRPAPSRVAMKSRDMAAADDVAGEAHCVDPTLNLASDCVPQVTGQRKALCAARLQPILRRVENELDRPLRVADMAQAVGLSLFHFSREFRRVAGVSPYAYIRRRRIARSALLLAGSKMPIVEIARIVGFKTHAHFSGAFLKTVGMTPRTYRLRFGARARPRATRTFSAPAGRADSAAA